MRNIGTVTEHSPHHKGGELGVVINSLFIPVCTSWKSLSILLFKK